MQPVGEPGREDFAPVMVAGVAPEIDVAELAPRDGKRLARIAAMDDIHQAAPRSAVEAGNVVPDRRAIQGRVFHPRHESGCGVAFPLDVTNSSISGHSKVEAEVEPAEYTVYNTTGENVTDLYLYVAGSEDKGENLAGEGLADGESIVITRDVEADKQDDVVYVLEFTTEDGQTQSFETLHYEVAPISLLSVDAAAGATPIAFTAPEN